MDADVTVVGAGPVGLMLACELALAGVSVQVLERHTEPDETIKAGSINVPTAEALYRRGLLPAAARAQERRFAEMASFFGGATGGSTLPAMPRRAGHFAGMMLDRDLVDEADPDLGGHGPADGVVLVHQADVEELLAARAAELGVPVRRGIAVSGVEPDDLGVTVRTDHGPVRTGWLVGCDGGRSAVRRAAGFDFPGTDPEITGHQAIVDIADPEKLRLGWNRTPTGVYAYGPVPGRILTVEFTGDLPDRTAPVTLAELQASLRHVSGTDVTLTGVRTATRWTDNARQASTYRRGRVLLAGDAAHVHSPFGGQGLNLGVGDAMNLGWKLAATVAGRAPDDLLDTYTAERHPVGAWVLDWTRAQVALMRPDPKTDALRAVVGDLMTTRPGMTQVVRKVAGVEHRYALPGAHPLVGRSAPDLELADGSRLGDAFRAGRFVLVDLIGEGVQGADPFGDRVTTVVGRCPDRPGLAGLLARPDGVVVWAADRGEGSEGSEGSEGFAPVLRRWCGASAVPASGA